MKGILNVSFHRWLFVFASVLSIIQISQLHELSSTLPAFSTPNDSLTNYNPPRREIRFSRDGQPVNTIVLAERDAILNCSAAIVETGSGANLKFDWLKDGHVLSLPSNASSLPHIRYSLDVDGRLRIHTVRNERVGFEATSFSSFVATSIESVTGVYQCMVTDRSTKSALLSQKALLTVASLGPLIKGPTNLRLGAGQRAVFLCATTPKSLPPSLKVTWLRDGQVITPHRVTPGRWGHDVRNGANSSQSAWPVASGQILVLDRLNERDAGIYKCKIEIPGEAEYSTETRLIVDPLGDDVEKEPAFLVKPWDLSFVTWSVAQSGRTMIIVIPCIATGNPHPKITWLKNGVELGKTKGEMEYEIVEPGFLLLHKYDHHSSGSYTCRAQNKLDSIDASMNLRMNVFPTLITRPAPIEMVKPNSDATLECGAMGSPRPQIKWYKDGTLLDDQAKGDYLRIDNRASAIQQQQQPNTAFSRLHLLGTVRSDTGIYQCFVTNSNGYDNLYLNPNFNGGPESLDLQASTLLLVGSGNKSGDDWPSVEESKASDTYPVASPLHQTPSEWSPLPIPTKTASITLFQLVKTEPKALLVAYDLSTILKPGQRYFLNFGAQGSTRQRSLEIASLSSPIRRGGQGRVWIRDLTPATSYKLHLSSTDPVQNYDQSTTFKTTTIVSPFPPVDRVPDTDDLAPKNLRAIPTSSTSIHVSWSGTKEIAVTTVQVVYTVYLRRLPRPLVAMLVRRMTSSPSSNVIGGLDDDVVRDSTNWEAAGADDEEAIDEEIDEEMINVRATSYHVSNLKPFTYYVVRVVAHSLDGTSSPSSIPVMVKTYSDVPSAPPQNITLEAKSSSQILVIWLPPPPGDRNGLINGYKLRYKSTLEGAKGLVHTTDGAQRHFLIQGLSRGTEYLVRISALTINGSGVPSEWFTTQTYFHDLDESRVPHAPSSLDVRPLDNSIIVSWTPPLNQAILVRGYTLGYGIGVPDIFSQVLGPNERFYTIKNLKASSEYVISLRAFNNLGNGRERLETVKTRSTKNPVSLMPPIGLKPLVLSPHSILLQWSDTTLHSDESVVDDRIYTIRFNSAAHSKYKYINSSQLNMLMEGLKPNTQYEFTVKVIRSDQEESTWSLSAFNTTEEAAPQSAPRDLTVLGVYNDSSSVFVNWQPPRSPNGRIIGYLIYYTTRANRPDPEWVVEGVKGNRLTTVIRELTPNTMYHFKIQARNNKGYGPMSPIVGHHTPKGDVRSGAYQRHSAKLYSVKGNSKEERDSFGAGLLMDDIKEADADGEDQKSGQRKKNSLYFAAAAVGVSLILVAVVGTSLLVVIKRKKAERNLATLDAAKKRGVIQQRKDYRDRDGECDSLDGSPGDFDLNLHGSTRKMTFKTATPLQQGSGSLRLADLPDDSSRGRRLCTVIRQRPPLFRTGSGLLELQASTPSVKTALEADACHCCSCCCGDQRTAASHSDYASGTESLTLNARARRCCCNAQQHPEALLLAAEDHDKRMFQHYLRKGGGGSELGTDSEDYNLELKSLTSHTPSCDHHNSQQHQRCHHKTGAILKATGSSGTTTFCSACRENVDTSQHHPNPLSALASPPSGGGCNSNTLMRKCHQTPIQQGCCCRQNHHPCDHNKSEGKSHGGPRNGGLPSRGCTGNNNGSNSPTSSLTTFLSSSNNTNSNTDCQCPAAPRPLPQIPCNQQRWLGDNNRNQGEMGCPEYRAASSRFDEMDDTESTILPPHLPPPPSLLTPLMMDNRPGDGSSIFDGCFTHSPRPQYPRTQYGTGLSNNRALGRQNSSQDGLALHGNQGGASILMGGGLHRKGVDDPTSFSPRSTARGNTPKNQQHPLKSFSIPSPPPTTTQPSDEQKAAGTPNAAAPDLLYQASKRDQELLKTTSHRNDPLLPKSRSSDELNKEISNLEGIINDINAITSINHQAHNSEYSAR